MINKETLALLDNKYKKHPYTNIDICFLRDDALTEVINIEFSKSTGKDALEAMAYEMYKRWEPYKDSKTWAVIFDHDTNSQYSTQIGVMYVGSLDYVYSKYYLNPFSTESNLKESETKEKYTCFIVPYDLRSRFNINNVYKLNYVCIHFDNYGDSIIYNKITRISLNSNDTEEQ